MGSASKFITDKVGSPVQKFMNKLPQSQFMNTFMFMYLLYAVFACLLVIAVFVLIAFDYGKFTFYEIYQKLALISNPNMFNKDTMDFESLYYAKNKTDDEPYTFYAQQTIVSNIFVLINIVIFTFFLQFFLFAVLKSIAISGHMKFTEQLFPMSDGTPFYKAMVILLVVAVLAITLNGYYNESFVKNLQPNIIDLSKNIDHISDMIYANITTDETFLNYVLDENITECIKYINKQEGRYENVGSMIFTMSLYNYFKVNVTSNSSAFNDIRKIFTLNSIRIRDIKPIDYMYFNQNIFISDQYPVLGEYISGKGKLLDTIDKQKRVRTNVATRVRHINTLFTALFRLSINRSNIKLHIFLEVIIIILFVFIIALIIFPEKVATYVWTNFSLFHLVR